MAWSEIEVSHPPPHFFKVLARVIVVYQMTCLGSVNPMFSYVAAFNVYNACIINISVEQLSVCIISVFIMIKIPGYQRVQTGVY